MTHDASSTTSTDPIFPLPDWVPIAWPPALARLRHLAGFALALHPLSPQAYRHSSPALFRNRVPLVFSPLDSSFVAIRRHLLLFLFVLYLVAYLHRVNISFAASGSAASCWSGDGWQVSDPLLGWTSNTTTNISICATAARLEGPSAARAA